MSLQAIGAGLGLIGGLVGAIGGGKQAKAAKAKLAELEGREPGYTVDPFYQQNLANAQSASGQQMDFAKQQSALGNQFASSLSANQAAFSKQMMGQATADAGKISRMGQMAFQRGLGPAGQMGMDAIAQTTAAATKSNIDRRAGFQMAGALGRSQMQNINQLVGQGYQAQTQGLGTMMSAQQAASNMVQQALGTTYQSGLQASQLGFGAQTSGLQAQQQAGLAGFQMTSQAGLAGAAANERKQQADWESWANKYQGTRSDLASARQMQSAGIAAIGSAAGGFAGLKKKG